MIFNEKLKRRSFKSSKMRMIVFAMALNEELYVEEWIDYHLSIGSV